MYKIIITLFGEKEEHTFRAEVDALKFMNKLIDNEIQIEKEAIENAYEDDVKEIERSKKRIEELEKLDRNDIFTLEHDHYVIFGDDGEAEIIRFDYLITDILDELELDYFHSNMSDSIYVVNLVYKDRRINPEDINKYFGTNLDKDAIILL